MRYKGLLTFEEADKCIDAGYRYAFSGYHVGGTVHVVDRDSVNWYQGDYHVDKKDYQGLAPTLGNPLPLCSVCKDGRVIIIQYEKYRLARVYFNGVNYLDEHSTIYNPFDIDGWYPVVIRED